MCQSFLDVMLNPYLQFCIGSSPPVLAAAIHKFSRGQFKTLERSSTDFWSCIAIGCPIISPRAVHSPPHTFLVKPVSGFMNDSLHSVTLIICNEENIKLITTEHLKT